MFYNPTAKLCIMFYVVIQFNVIQHKLRKNTQNVLSPPRAIKLGCKWPYLTTQWYTLVLLSDICHGYEREEEGGCWSTCVVRRFWRKYITWICFLRIFLVLLLGSVTSSPVSRTEVARMAKRAVSPDLVLVAAREGISRPEPRQDTQQFNLPAGQALDLFYR